MPSPAQIAELTRRSDHIVTLVESRLRTLWHALDPTDPAHFTTALLGAAPLLVDAGADAASLVAGDWFDERRTAQRVAGRHSAELAPPLPDDQVDAMVRWAVGPVWSDGNPDAGLARLLAGAARLTRNAGRDTIARSTRTDPAAIGYVRVPRSASACSFCLMLASRGPAYTSEAAGELVGFSGRTRGTQGAGDRFHDHCRCTTSPVWTPDDIPPINLALDQEWAEVTKGLTGADARKAWDAHIAKTRGPATATGAGAGGGGRKPPRILANSGGEWPDKPGHLDETARKLSRKERRVADFLTATGRNVTALAPIHHGGYTPPSADVLVDGIITEFKSPVGDTKNTIQRHLRRGRHQARNLVIDLRESSIDQALAERALRGGLAQYPDSFDRVWIISHRYDLWWER